MNNFVMSTYPSGGIYRWPYNIEPTTVLGSTPADRVPEYLHPWCERAGTHVIVTAKLAYEQRLEPFYSILEEQNEA